MGNGMLHYAVGARITTYRLMGCVGYENYKQINLKQIEINSTEFPN